MTIGWKHVPCMGGCVLSTWVADLELQAWEDACGVAWSVQRAGQVLDKGSIREDWDGRPVFEPSYATIADVENIVDRSRWIRAAQSAALNAASHIVQADALGLHQIAAALSRAATEA